MAVTGLRSRQSNTVWFMLASDVFRFIESCQEDPVSRNIHVRQLLKGPVKLITVLAPLVTSWNTFSQSPPVSMQKIDAKLRQSKM
jgi:hypothetical protein